jgi:hypothetical protein
MTRTVKSQVTFAHPFSLAGLDRIQPAGTYAIETDEELIQDLSFPVHRRVAMRMTLADPSRPGCVETVDVEPTELAAALASDSAA